MTETTEPIVRTARQRGACGAPGCTNDIWPGVKITKPGPDKAWQHLDCSNPGKPSNAVRQAVKRAAQARARGRRR